MKKYIIYLLCLLTALFSGIASISAKQIIPEPDPCHKFLFTDFRGTLHETGRMPGFGGSQYYYSYGTDCTQADIEYDDFLKNNVYPFLYILLALSSGLGYFGYKKYKAKKLMSNIETKNTSPANPE